MIVVRLEMWPKGDAARARSLGIATIENAGGDLQTGHYLCRLFKAPEYSRTAETRPLSEMLTRPLAREVWRKGSVQDFPRARLGPWDLLYRSLGSLVRERSPGLSDDELGPPWTPVPGDPWLVAAARAEREEEEASIRSGEAEGTQRSRARRAREGFKSMFRRIDDLRLELNGILDEAQNAPPEGASDGTIDEVEFNQFRSVERAASALILSLLFGRPE